MARAGEPAAAATAPDQRVPGAGGLGRNARISLAFLVVALLLLLVIPILTQRRVDAILDEIEDVAQPAADANGAFQVTLAHESSWLLLFHVTENERYRRRYVDALRAERDALARLDRLAEPLGAAVETRVSELRRAHDLWLETVDRAGFLERGQEPVTFLQRFAEFHEQYEAVAAAAGRVDDAIQRAISERREALELAVRIRTIGTISLAVLALVAVMIVVRIGRRFAWLAADIERRRRETEAGRRELERVTESRSRLMRGFSHDLKNPLGAADGQAALLATGAFGPVNEDQREAVGRLRSSIASALGLIDNVLELARIEAGRVEVRRTAVDLPAIVREVVDEYRPQADAKAVALDVVLPGSLPSIASDPARIRQILQNLLGNAVKYTPTRGGVSVRVDVRDDGRAPRPGRWVAVEVRDTGPGIAPEDQQRVFEEFTRLAGAAAGAGLGLAISRTVARMLGGEVTLESEVGRGSNFTLWLPVAAAS